MHVERGVYAATKTGDMTPKQVLEAVERLEGQAPQINAQNGGGGIGTTFKLADVIG